MEQISMYLKRKSQILYDMNCIQKYITGGDYDENLKRAWDGYKKELEEIEQKIEERRKPQLQEFEEKKLELYSQIKEYEEEIESLKKQLVELDKIITKLV